MRSSPATLLVLAFALCACGGDDDVRPGVRVRLLTGTHDGFVQGRLKAQVPERRDLVYDLEPVPGDPGLYAGPDVPPGRYRLFTDAGWGMLWFGGLNASVPTLNDATGPVTTVRMGRPRTLYVAPTNPNTWQLGETWGADYRPASDPQGPYRPVPFEMKRDDEGIVSLAFGAEHWQLHNEIRVLGQMTSGHVTNLVSYVIGDAKYPDLPRLAMVHGAQHAPLRIVLVPPPGVKHVPDGTRAQVALNGVPFPNAYEDTSFRGEVRFSGVAALGGGLRIALPEGGKHAVWDLGTHEWRLGGGMFLVAIDPEKAVTVPLPESEDPVTHVHVRFGGEGPYGRVPLTPGGLLTHPGRQSLLLRRASGVWHVVPATVPETGAAALPLGAPLAGCRMKGSVAGAGPGFRVDFRMVPDDGAASGGFTAVVSHTGEYDVHLPPGKVEVQVVAPTGTKSAIRTMDLRPGNTYRMNLSAR